MEEKKMDLLDVSSDVLSAEACKILLEKKGLDVKMFCVKDVTSITDYYVNATGRSSTQVAALADDLVDLIGERGRSVLRVEGRSGGAWVLCDFGDVIVNVFDKASREFYNFDRHLPAECEMDISALVSEVDAKFDINKN
ncbi:MAG: ribosome silencing factor [Clostridia bacterium]|nr:ribosome silencing factor [Clostridia bacterium]